MLVQFALMIFALCGLLSLVVDMGYMRLTQAQMQSAADTAALEGVRKRDAGVLNPVTGQTVNDPFASDCIRRAAAARLVRWTFDDDFDVTNGDPYQFGGGPLLATDEGMTDLHAGKLMRAPEGGYAYKPAMQFNQQNASYGDMVSGRYCYNPDPLAPEGERFSDPSALVCAENQRGSGIYARSDFNPSPAAPQPPVSLPGCPALDDVAPSPWPIGGTGTLDGADDSAFLVRLRRSTEFADQAGQTEDGVASSGPSIPLMFAMGTLIHGDPVDGSYSPRRDGLTVRASAIAEARPATQVGLPQPSAGVPGVTPFTFVDTFVRVLNAVGCPVTVTPATGLITSAAGGAAGCPAAGLTVGRFIDNPATPTVARWQAVSRVGRTLPPAVATAACAVMATPAVSSLFSGYGAVYSLLTSGTNRVIGFTRLGLAPAACPAPPPPGTPVTFPATASRGVSLVAAVNATAAAPGALEVTGTFTTAEFRQLMDRHFVRAGAADYAPVLASVLAR